MYSRTAYLLILGVLPALLLTGCGGGMNTTGVSGEGAFDGLGGTSAGGASTAIGDAFWDLQALKQSPESTLVSETTEAAAGGEVVVREITYKSPGVGADELEIFAYYAFPAGKGSVKLPAIVWVHGGASVASRDAVVEWASRGYAAISMDLPGKGGPDRETSRSQGPDMIDDNIFSVKPSPRSSYLYLCVNAVCRAISWIGAQDSVDPTRIGVLGYSWGGVIALLVNGIDGRVSAACTVFGAGYITEESCWTKSQLNKLARSDIETWKKHYDPASYLGSLHGKTLFVGATDDTFYPLTSLTRTYEGAQCVKSICLVPNKNHEIDATCAANIQRWFDWALRSGPPLPEFRVASSNGRLVISSNSKRPLVAAQLFTQSKADGEWTSIDLRESDGAWNCAMPVAGCSLYVTAIEDSGASVAGGITLQPRQD